MRKVVSKQFLLRGEACCDQTILLHVFKGSDGFNGDRQAGQETDVLVELGLGLQVCGHGGLHNVEPFVVGSALADGIADPMVRGRAWLSDVLNHLLQCNLEQTPIEL